MRDDFDSVVADRFKVLDQVPVPDTWSRIRETEEVLTMLHVDSSTPTLDLDLDLALPPGPRRKRSLRVLVAGSMAAAAVAAMVFVTTRDTQHPADDLFPTMVVPAPPPPRALFGTPDEEFAAGTYFVDEVEGVLTPRILVTIGAGWTNTADRWGIGQDDVGFVTFSRPDAVFVDACHWTDGYHPGPVTTLDGLVSALSEQGGWVDVTVPSEISVSGYEGRAFQRTAPAGFADCDGAFAPFRSWENVDEDGNPGWSYYEPGEIETVWVLDVDGTIIILNARTGADQPAAAHTAFAAILDTIRIDRT